MRPVQMMMMLPGGLPVSMPPPPAPSYRPPPMRVRVAFEYLSYISSVLSPQAAVSESQVEVLPIRVLSDEEETTRATALNLLTKYLAGSLQPDLWEVEEMKIEKEEQQEGCLLRCVACGGENSHCKLCNGSGRLLVFAGGRDPVIATPSGEEPT